MSENNWWREHGPFQSWKKYPTRPNPREVLQISLEKQGVEPEEQVVSLIDLLDLQEPIVSNILKGESWDSISRCRLLVHALNIYPPLLGIDAKYDPIEHHAYWWRAHGFLFNADTQGYPVMSEVVAHLRMQRTIGKEGGRAWTPDDLAIASGLSKDTIDELEHNTNLIISDRMSIRLILALALGTLAGDQEPTLFRLFGLAPQAYGVPGADH